MRDMVTSLDVRRTLEEPYDMSSARPGREATRLLDKVNPWVNVYLEVK